MQHNTLEIRPSACWSSVLLCVAGGVCHMTDLVCFSVFLCTNPWAVDSLGFASSCLLFCLLPAHMDFLPQLGNGHWSNTDIEHIIGLSDSVCSSGSGGNNILQQKTALRQGPGKQPVFNNRSFPFYVYCIRFLRLPSQSATNLVA